MVRYLLDTNAVIALLNDAASPLALRARRFAPSEIALSSIVCHELFYGAFKSRRIERNVAIVDRLQLAVLDFDREDARHAGAIRAALESKGTPIGPYDALIAGQARARELVLVTRNTREFSRVEGLRSENWESA